MPTYLHAAISRHDQLIKHVVEHTAEALHVDFKREFYKDEQRNNTVVPAQEEAAKDVASFANAEGGDIIIGITDQGHRAGVFFDTPNVVGIETKFREWLRNRLAPREVAETVTMKLWEFDHDQKQRQVLVVTVPPWPHGAVSVWDGDSDKAGYFFPVRRGDDTRYLRFEELMRLTDPKKRSMFLRLKELEREERQFILATPINALGNSFPMQVTVADGKHGEIRSISEDVVILSMVGTRAPLTWGTSQAVTIYPTPEPIEIAWNRPLAVPLELVRAAWRDPDGPRLLQLALEGTVLWDSDRWRLKFYEPAPR
jgi:hypothetical protein